MFKYAVVIFALIACAAAKPGLIGAPFVAAPAPVITATSSQVVARTYNGIAHAPIVAPVAPIAPVAKVVAPVAPVARVVAPVAPVARVVPAVAPVARVVAPAHVAHVAAPFATAAYTAPVVARYATAAYATPFAARYTAPLAYSAPFAYSHAPYAASYAW